MATVVEHIRILTKCHKWGCWATTTGIIFDIMKYAIHDGPGIRTVVFLKGCPLHCGWCHNPESQRSTPEIIRFPEKCIGCGQCKTQCTYGVLEPAGEKGENCTGCGSCSAVCNSGARELVGRRMTVRQVLKEIDQDLVFYEESGGGVTFSGGEPLLQADFLAEVLQACNEREIHTAIETTGFAQPEKIQLLMPLVNLWLFDLKLMDEQRHLQATGVSNGLILANLQMLVQAKAKVVVRIPLIPGINDNEENLAALGQFLSNLQTVREVHILPYHKAGVEKYRRLEREYGLNVLHTPTDDELARVVAKLELFGLQVKIGG